MDQSAELIVRLPVKQMKDGFRQRSRNSVAAQLPCSPCTPARVPVAPGHRRTICAPRGTERQMLRSDAARAPRSAPFRRTPGGSVELENCGQSCPLCRAPCRHEKQKGTGPVHSVFDFYVHHRSITSGSVPATGAPARRAYKGGTLEFKLVLD